jgi:hypothetical protein
MQWCGIELGGQSEPGGTSAAGFRSSELRRRRIQAAAHAGDRCGSPTGREEDAGEH